MILRSILGVLILSISFMLASANALASNARVHCVYMKADNSIEVVKLLGTDLQGASFSRTIQVDVIPHKTHTHAFVISSDTADTLIHECQTFVGVRGTVVDFRGSFKDSYEIWQRFYGLYPFQILFSTAAEVNAPDTAEEEAVSVALLSSGVFAFTRLTDLGQQNIDATNLEALENQSTINLQTQALLEQFINDHGGDLEAALQQLPHEIFKAEIGNIGGELKAQVGQHAYKALVISAILAGIWFKGPLVAAAAKAIYPYAYRLFVGSIPSVWNLTYWTVYLPGEYHVVGLAYQYSGPILAAGTAFSYATWQLGQAFAVKVQNSRIAHSLFPYPSLDKGVVPFEIDSENEDDDFEVIDVAPNAEEAY